MVDGPSLDRVELIEQRKRLARPRIQDFSQLRIGDVLRMRSGLEDTAWFEVVIGGLEFDEHSILTAIAMGIGCLVKESPLPFPTDGPPLLGFAEYEASILDPFATPTGPLIDVYLTQKARFISGIPYCQATNEPLLPECVTPNWPSYALSLDAWLSEK